MAHHTNNGKCEKCKEIFEKYPGFYQPLRDWFEEFQSRHPESHISCAGRGSEEQQIAFSNGSSKAHYGESSHNYNCAIDIFEEQGDPKNLWENAWFQSILKPEIDAHPNIDWYGRPDAKFKELPHCEWNSWKQLRESGILKLVEPIPDEVA